MRLGRWTSLALGLLLSVVSGASTPGCKYDPHPINGALGCGPADECPDGYTCRSNRCWSTSGQNDAGGPGPDAITPSANIADYVGQWLLTTTATVKTSCDDGYSDTTLLSPADSPSTMSISRSSGSDGLLSSWLCDLTLRFDGSGAHLNDSNPSCMDMGGDPLYTWTASKFDVVAAVGGATAMHTATYKRKDTYAAGTVTNCDQQVVAPMTKQP